MSTYLEDHTQPEPVINYVHVEDPNADKIKPKITITTSGTDSTYTIGKPKRKRKEWVYKSEYDRLKRKYSILTWIAAVGWFGLLIALKMAI